MASIRNSDQHQFFAAARNTRSSPVKPNTVTFSNKIPKAEDQHKQTARQMYPSSYGPVKVEDFLKHYVPRAAQGPAPLLPDFFSSIPTGGAEKKMYDALEKVLNDDPNSIIKGLKLVNTSHHPDNSSKTSAQMRPDACLYKETDDTTSARTQYSIYQLGAELKPKDVSDGFKDAKTDFQSAAQNHTTVRGQMADYVQLQFSRQHRTHLFFMYMGRNEARLFRWDRAGVIVTESFNYRQNGQALVEFLWRFARMSDIERGWDATVRLATDAEASFAKKRLARWQSSDWPIRAFWVPEDSSKVDKKLLYGPETANPNGGQPADGRKYRKFLAWSPLATPASPVGRGTYGYPVCEENSEDEEPLFLKDYWPSDADSVEKEGLILRELNAKGVRHVPNLVCEGVLGQNTLTHVMAELLELEALIEKRTHYRFVEDCVAAPIDTFTSSEQMLRAVYHAFLAHKDAYEKCRILHRDISIGNIMLKADGYHGILNDWDLSIQLDKYNGARQKERTGTWQFMSYRLLQNPSKLHEVQDDMESFLYVILYLGLAFLENNQLGHIVSYMDKLFDECTPYGAIYKGGDKKGSLYSEFIQFTHCPPLTGFVKYAVKAVQEYIVYCAEDEESKREDADQDTDFDPFADLLPSGSGTQRAREDLRLKDHAYMENLFTRALSAKGWPIVNDRKDDQREKPVFRSEVIRDVRIQSMPPMSTNPTPAPPRFTKREREEDDDGVEDGEELVPSASKKPKTLTPKVSMSTF